MIKDLICFYDGKGSPTPLPPSARAQKAFPTKLVQVMGGADAFGAYPRTTIRRRADWQGKLDFLLPPLRYLDKEISLSEKFVYLQHPVTVGFVQNPQGLSVPFAAVVVCPRCDPSSAEAFVITTVAERVFVKAAPQVDPHLFSTTLDDGFCHGEVLRLSQLLQGEHPDYILCTKEELT